MLSRTQYALTKTMTAVESLTLKARHTALALRRSGHYGHLCPVKPESTGVRGRSDLLPQPSFPQPSFPQPSRYWILLSKPSATTGATCCRRRSWREALLGEDGVLYVRHIDISGSCGNDGAPGSTMTGPGNPEHISESGYLEWDLIEAGPEPRRFAGPFCQALTVALQQLADDPEGSRNRLGPGPASLQDTRSSSCPRATERDVTSLFQP